MAAMVDRWFDISTLTPRVRGSVRSILLRVGRWLEAEHPEAADPANWTRQTCATWIAALDRMKVGDYVQRTVGLNDRLGKPLEPPTKARTDRRGPAILPGLPGMGVAAKAFRSQPHTGHPTQHRRPARSRSSRDRRRCLGETDVGRVEPDC